MIGALIVGAVGVVFIVLGVLIWKKEKVELLHDYHRDRVKEADKKAFCTLSGWGVLSVGIGLLITMAALWLTDSVRSFWFFAIGFAVGLALLILAGKKYNSDRKE